MKHDFTLIKKPSSFNTYISHFTKLNGALFLFFLSPFFVPYLINPRIFAFYSIPAFLLCLCAVLFLKSETEKKATFIPLTSLFLFLTITLAIGYAFHPSFSVYGNAEVPLLILVSFIAFFAASQSGIAVKSAYLAYLPTAFLWILIALPVWLGWTDGIPLHVGDLWALTTDPQNKMNGPFTNGNILAILIAIAWIISVFYWLKNSRSYAWWFLQTFFWIWVIAGMSRGAWLAQAFILIWIAAFLIRSKAYKQLILLLIAGVIAWTAAFSLFSTVQPDASSAIQERFSSGQEGIGAEARIILWHSAFEMWKEHPWLGVGAGRFDAHFLDAQAAALASMDDGVAGLETGFDSAHNLLLHLMAELGFAGIILWLAISLLLAQKIWRYRYRLLSPQWPALAAASMLWIQGMVNITMTDPFPVLLFALLLGWCYAPTLRKAQLDGLHGLSFPKKNLAITSISFAVLMFAGALSTASVWLDFEKWTYLEMTNPDKGRAASQFISRDDILPYLIQTSVNELYSIGNREAVGNMQPLIIQAISAQQHPILFRQLFFSHAIRGEFELACETGRFITRQHWPNEKNSALYQAACENRLSQTLEIQK